MEIAVVILTGGKSTRMGMDKAKLVIENQTFLERICDEFKEYPYRYISDCKNGNHSIDGYRTIWDEYENIGPMNGIISFFHQVNMDVVFVTSCDMPYMKKEIVEKLYAYLNEYDGVFVKENDHLHPLGGIYTRKMVERIEQQIMNKKYSLYTCIKNSNVCILDIDAIKIDKKMYLNINNREIYEDTIKG
ncbi:MAG: molybdenum cofactor guanylyltransferase [Holdemanella sp.]|nr:molybdenum cofactor guanylyltransferase [Holdemanella sp.]